MWGYTAGLHIAPIEKLIKISNLFDTILDYLLKGNETDMTELHSIKLMKRFREMVNFLRSGG